MEVGVLLRLTAFYFLSYRVGIQVPDLLVSKFTFIFHVQGVINSKSVLTRKITERCARAKLGTLLIPE